MNLLYKEAIKTNILRFLDKYLGPSLCMFVLVVRLVGNLGSVSLREGKTRQSPRKILVIKFFGMGSILLAGPALGATKRKYPKTTISILTLAGNADTCELVPWIDTLYLLSLKTPLNFAKSYCQCLYQIRKNNYDIVVDLEFLTRFSSLTTLLISLFDKRVTTIGFNSPDTWRNSVYSMNISFDHSRHITNVFTKVFSSFCGTPLDVSTTEEGNYILSKAETGFMNDIPNLSIGDESQSAHNFLIAININAGSLNFNRRWPTEYFSLVSASLCKKPGVKLILIGGNNDTEYVEKFICSLPDQEDVINLCGKLTIKQLVGLFSRSQLLITNDSGPLHIAHMIGLSTISFFGPETPYLYGPIGDNHHVFYEDLYCSPCLNIYNSKSYKCQNNICLKKIQPLKVLALIEEKYLRDLEQPGSTVSH